MSIFSKVKLTRPKRSTFNLSHETKWTTEAGLLLPTYWTYLEPYSQVKASSAIMMRVAPYIAPIMHRVNIYNWWFAVPIRILMEQEHFESFFTGGVDGKSDIGWPKLRFTASMTTNDFDPTIMRLYDMLDFPTRYGITDSDRVHDLFEIDVMPFRAYQKIYNDNFRDENIIEEIPIDKFVGTRDAKLADRGDLFQVRRRAWDKDYFTSALPTPQRGDDMNMPFSAVSQLAMDSSVTSPTKARVYPNPNVDDPTAPFSSNHLTNESDFPTPISGAEYYDAVQNVWDDDTETAHNVQYDVTRHTKVNTAILGTINQLREAFAIQRWRERMNVGGSRYIEQMRSMFGVVGDDARLQRPLYLGGSRVPIQISEVLQTSESTDTSLQAVPAGRGFAVDGQRTIKHFAKEHEILMCISCVVPKANYMQGMPRKCNISDRFDFPWPILGHLGEQEVKNEELFWSGDSRQQENNAGTFGYQSRYAQYKFEPNRVHGQFKDTLDFWHMARKFAAAPSLSQEFLEINASRDDINRVFAVPGSDDVYDGVTDHYWAQQAFNIKIKRPLPYFGTPKP